jgi:type I restriction enzyme R subunit
MNLASLTTSLLASLDADAQAKKAAEIFGLPKDQEPTQEQLDQVQGDMMREALKPLHDPKLRDLLLNLKRSHEQVIDEITQDELLQAGYDAHALEKAQALIKNFKDFIEGHKDELEAIQILYSRPHREGLRFRHVKDLAAALKNPPMGATPERVWRAYEATEPQAVKAKGGRDLVDLIALVRHALDPEVPLAPTPARCKSATSNGLRSRHRRASTSPKSSASGSTRSKITSPRVCGSTRTTSTMPRSIQLGDWGGFMICSGRSCQ